jgi:hypothetical protein
LVDGERFAVVKPRREAEAQFADERIPAWLDPVRAEAGAG